MFTMFNSLMSAAVDQLIMIKERNSAVEAAASNMKKLAIGCSDMDWDGFGASPVTNSHLEAALALLSMLPSDIPIPEIGVDPEGCFSFDWHRGMDRVFSTSIAHDGMLSNAWANNQSSGVSVCGISSYMADFFDSVRMVICHQSSD